MPIILSIVAHYRPIDFFGIANYIGKITSLELQYTEAFASYFRLGWRKTSTYISLESCAFWSAWLPSTMLNLYRLLLSPFSRPE